MFYCMNKEALTGFDNIFMLDDKMNISNIVGALFFEEFEFEEMKNYIHSKTGKLHKCRSKLVESVGVYWWQKMSDQEWEIK